MDLHTIDFSKKERRTVILAVTIGNVLEWYEIYLYVYWAPIISSLFFSPREDNGNLINTFLIFALGFLARPLGGLFFGRLGDRIGRKKSLILSLLVMTVPTFVTGLLPTYAEIGLLAPWILACMRILQSFPAGGELPGAFCYLYESARPQNRRYMCSWAALGYQVGVLISTLECFFLEQILPRQDLLTWGWRVSFLIGGIIGLFGLCLRYKLHETPLFREMVQHEKVVKQSIWEVLYKHRKGIFLGFLFCALNSSAFYLISVNFPVSFGQILDTSYVNNLVITTLILLLITLPLPYFGRLGDLYSNRKMLIGSTLGILALLYPLYLSIQQEAAFPMGLFLFFFGLFFTVLSALIPYIMCPLFPTAVRFTCVAVSFNIVDAVIGGFTPALTLYLYDLTGEQASFCWILLGTGLLSLISYFAIKPHHEASH